MKHQIALFALSVSALVSPQALRADEVIYDNTSNKLDITYGSLNEFGDQIFFAGNEKMLTSLIFEYYGRDFSGDEKIRLSIYSNDGSLTGTVPDANRPGTLLYASDWDDLPQSSSFGNTLAYNLLPHSVVVTNNFTWTVEFQGMTAEEFAGLALYDAANPIGVSFDDFWERDEFGNWQLRQANSGVPMNFGARISATTPVAEIVAHPQSVATTGGSPVTFTVEATGASIEYQWFRNGVAIPGATTSVYNIPAAHQANAGSYRVSINNDYGPELLSNIATLTVDYTVATDLTLITNGVGSIIHKPKPALTEGGNPFRLFVGRTYKLKAVETGFPNQILTNWTATWEGQSAPVIVQTNSLTYTFTMKSNMVISANFVSNPFLAASGPYSGLFSDPINGVNPESAGYFQIKVSANRVFSGKALVEGYPIRLSGKFGLDGTFAGVTKTRFTRIGKPELNYSLALDFNSSAVINGTISQGSDWTAQMLGDRAIWRKSGPPQATAYTNSYTMLIPGFADKTDGPVGSTFALVNVTLPGRVFTAGRSADGESFRQSTYISQDGMWPAYFPMRKEVRFHNGKRVVESKSVIMGWLEIAPNEFGNMAPIGDMKWTRAAIPSATFYASGFTNDVEVLASRWLPPVSGSGIRAVDFDAAKLDFTEGNLSSPFSMEYLVTDRTTFERDSEFTYLPGMSAHFRPKRGYYFGSFVHPNNALVSTRFFGVVLQDYNYGEGLFMGTTEGGRVELEERVQP